MTIEFKAGIYFHGIWYMDHPEFNCMGALFREKGEPWTLRFRKREYVDDKVFESEDTRRWYAVDFGFEEEEVAGRMAADLFRMLAEHTNMSEVQFLPLRMDGGDPRAIKAVQEAPWAHSQTVTRH